MPLQRFPQIYKSELAPSGHLNVFGAAGPLGQCVAILACYAAGAYLRWRKVALLCAGITALALAALAFFLPESPKWLIMKGRFEEGKVSRFSAIWILLYSRILDCACTHHLFSLSSEHVYIYI